MATQMIVKLTRGGASLDLNDQTNYRVAVGFVPPSVILQPVIAEGGSTNRFGGGKLVDQKAASRPFTFTIHILGTSEADVSAKGDVVAAFLAMAGDVEEPLYLEYRANSDIAAEPLWGQRGANRRYEVIAAQGPTAGRMSGPANLRAQAIVNMQISLTLGPYALGKQQEVCSAMGGVQDDVVGALDGISRGLIAPESTTNLFANPVFGNATYTTAWTAGASLVTTKINDQRRTYPGAENALRALASAATNNTLTQSLTLPATSHTITFWVRRLDNGAVSTSQADITYDGSAQTTTYTNLGNGVWRMHATVTGTTAAAATGLLVKNKMTLEVLGAQCEAKAYPTPLACGDFLGHSWSGVSHAASVTSTRTEARVRLPIAEGENFNRGSGAIRLVWRPHVANDHPNDQYLFDTRDGSNTNGLSARYLAASDSINFSRGASSLGTVAVTFAAFSVYVLHFVWGPDNMEMYVNGTRIGVGLSFLANSTGGYIYIGADYSGTDGSQCLGTIMDFAIYASELTAAEVLADYANVWPVVNGGKRAGAIPWLYTKDGDNVADNGLDTASSTGAPHENFAVVGGIAGSAPAETVFWVDPDSGVSTIYLANWAIPFYLSPGACLYYEQGGTAGAATDSNADYKASTGVGTTEVALATSGTAWESKQKMRLLAGREFCIATRLYDVSGSNLLLAFRFYINNTVSGGESVVTEFEAPKTLSTLYFGVSLTPALVLPPLIEIYPLSSVDIEDPAMVLAGKRTTGSADVRVDYMMLMPAPLMAFAAHTFGNVICGRRVTSLTTGGGVAFIRQITGDVIELQPAQYNVLLVALHNGGTNTTIQGTLQFEHVYITPRFALF